MLAAPLYTGACDSDEHLRVSAMHDFAVGEVVKKDGEVKLTAKAYNGRCITEWLATVSRDAAARWPHLERLQLQSVCMRLGPSKTRKTLLQGPRWRAS